MGEVVREWVTENEWGGRMGEGVGDGEQMGEGGCDRE